MLGRKYFSLSLRFGPYLSTFVSTIFLHFCVQLYTKGLCTAGFWSSMGIPQFSSQNAGGRTRRLATTNPGPLRITGPHTPPTNNGSPHPSRSFPKFHLPDPGPWHYHESWCWLTKLTLITWTPLKLMFFILDLTCKTSLELKVSLAARSLENI